MLQVLYKKKLIFHVPLSQAKLIGDYFLQLAMLGKQVHLTYNEPIYILANPIICV
jgi:hypothetical protein